MKKQNTILMTLVALLLTKSAYANVNSSDVVATDPKEKASLAEVQTLLERLTEANALEIGEDGNVRLKPSVLDKLKSSDRFQKVSSAWSIICT